MVESPKWGPMPAPLGEPVTPPAIRAGDDARAVLGDYRGALAQANDRLEATRRYYDDVRNATGGRFGHN